MGDTQIVEEAQRLSREVAQLGVGAFGLELDDHHHRDDDLVLVEAHQCVRVREQDRRVDHVGAHVTVGAGGRASSRSGHRVLPRYGPAGRRPE